MRNYFKWGFLKAFGIIALAALFIFTGCANATSGGGGDLPLISGAVTISGIAQVGATLTANITALAGDGTPSWQQDNRGNGAFTNISGAARMVTYTVTEANLGNRIRVTVSRSGYSGSVTSGPTAAVTGAVELILDPIVVVKATINASPQGGSVSDPIILPIGFDLGDMTDSGSNWQRLLTALQDEGKYVALDLSACTMNGGTGMAFAPYKNNATGENKVVSMVLPTVAQTITEGNNGYDTYTFGRFTALTTINGANITAVPASAFRGITSLTQASFPEVAEIGDWAFLGCSALTEVDFPEVETICAGAFMNCSALEEANFPKATFTDGYAFQGCAALESVSFTAAAGRVWTNSFSNVGTNAGVTAFTITIGTNWNFEDTNLQWSPGDTFKTVYDSGSVSGTAKAGGTYTCTTATGDWTYTP